MRRGSSSSPRSGAEDASSTISLASSAPPIYQRYRFCGSSSRSPLEAPLLPPSLLLWARGPEQIPCSLPPQCRALAPLRGASLLGRARRTSLPRPCKNGPPRVSCCSLIASSGAASWSRPLLCAVAVSQSCRLMSYSAQTLAFLESSGVAPLDLWHISDRSAPLEAGWREAWEEVRRGLEPTNTTILDWDEPP